MLGGYLKVMIYFFTSLCDSLGVALVISIVLGCLNLPEFLLLGDSFSLFLLSIGK